MDVFNDIINRNLSQNTPLEEVVQHAQHIAQAQATGHTFAEALDAPLPDSDIESYTSARSDVSTPEITDDEIIGVRQRTRDTEDFQRAHRFA